jgi:hypothetical protein
VLAVSVRFTGSCLEAPPQGVPHRTDHGAIVAEAQGHHPATSPIAPR